jgi:hypothetical protein
MVRQQAWQELVTVCVCGEVVPDGVGYQAWAMWLHGCVDSASPLVKNRGSCLCAVLVYDGGDTKGARSPGVGRNHMH